MTLRWMRVLRRLAAAGALVFWLGMQVASAAPGLNADPVVPGVSFIGATPAPSPAARTTRAAATIATPAPSSFPSNDPWRGAADDSTTQPSAGATDHLTQPIVDLLTNPAWQQKAITVAVTLFRVLFLIELAETAGVWLWQGRGRVAVENVLTAYVGKLVQAAVMIFLIMKAPDMLGYGVTYTRALAFQVVSAGAGITNSDTANAYAQVMNGPIDIGSVVAFGMSNGGKLLAAKIDLPTDSTGAPCDPWNIATSPTGPTNCVTGGVANSVTHALAEHVVGFVIALIAAVAVWLAFLLIGIELFGITIEAIFQQNIGAVFLGFLGYQRVARYGWNYFYYIINVCGRLFVIYSMVGVGEVFFLHALSVINADPDKGVDPASMFLICASAWLFFFMVRKLNKWAATLLSGQSHADGMHDYVAPAATAAGMALAGATLAVGAAAGGAAALRGAMVKNGIQGGAAGAARGGGITGSPARPIRPALPAGRDTIDAAGVAVPPPRTLPASPKALPGPSNRSSAAPPPPPSRPPQGPTNGSSAADPSRAGGAQSSTSTSTSQATGSADTPQSERSPRGATASADDAQRGASRRDRGDNSAAETSVDESAAHRVDAASHVDFGERGVSDVHVEPPPIELNAPGGPSRPSPLSRAAQDVEPTRSTTRSHREDSDQRAARLAGSDAREPAHRGTRSDGRPDAPDANASAPPGASAVAPASVRREAPPAGGVAATVAPSSVRRETPQAAGASPAATPSVRGEGPRAAGEAPGAARGASPTSRSTVGNDSASRGSGGKPSARSVNDDFWRDYDRIARERTGSGDEDAVHREAGGAGDAGQPHDATPPYDAAPSSERRTDGTVTVEPPPREHAGDGPRAVGRDGTVYESEILGPDDGHDPSWEPGPRPDYAFEDGHDIDAGPEHDTATPGHDERDDRRFSRAEAPGDPGRSEGPRTDREGGESFRSRTSSPGRDDRRTFDGPRGGYDDPRAGFAADRGPRPRFNHRRQRRDADAPQPPRRPIGINTVDAIHDAAQRTQRADRIAAAIHEQAQNQEAQRRRQALRQRIAAGFRTLMTPQPTSGQHHADITMNHLR